MIERINAIKLNIINIVRIVLIVVSILSKLSDFKSLTFQSLPSLSSSKRLSIFLTTEATLYMSSTPTTPRLYSPV